VKNCTTSEELAKLIENAFDTWSDPNARRSEDKRQTPRVRLEKTQNLLLVSYTHKQVEHHVGVHADLVDISADGLGVVVTKPIPLGATVRFAMANSAGQPVFGYARVARTTLQNKKHWVGLTFMEPTEHLDLEEPSKNAKNAGGAAPNQRTPDYVFQQVRRRAFLAFRRIFSGYRSVKTVTRYDHGKRAAFRIETKLFRYDAALDVDGTRVAFASWPIETRYKKPIGDDTQCTVVQLEGDGFCATATLRTGTVMSCDLQTGSQTSRQRFLAAQQYDPAALNIELGPPHNDPPNKVITCRTTTSNHRKT